MAMIKCPKCNKDISDKSEKCVHCGNVLIEKSKIFCEECGNELKQKEKFCKKCGCPINEKKEIPEPQKVEVTKVSIGNSFSKKKIIIILTSILIVIGITIGGIIIYKNIQEKKAKELSEKYKQNLSTITYKMLDGAAKAETCGNKIKKVWYNSIWKENDSETDKYTKKDGVFNSDFNVSLSALFADSDFITTKNKVKGNQLEVNGLMKKMKNPPEEWKDAYDDLKDYYDDYLTLTNLCIDPSGSLQTYSTKFSNADSDTVNGYNKMKTHID